MNFFKKYHKWLGVVLAYFILSFVVSGIILNHRETLSSIDISRKLLPKNYRYENWNSASLKSALKHSNDSILLYGNIGIWMTDSSYGKFRDLNAGFPKGIDNRKVHVMLQTKNKELLAGTLFGLYRYNPTVHEWEKLTIPGNEERITDIIQKEDSVYILTRSQLITTSNLKDFRLIQLPAPEGYDNKIGLFKTFWVIHSGEIYGIVGKLIVDIAGLIFAFLTVTGFILFVNRIILKKNKRPKAKNKKMARSNRWNLKWHNKLGWITVILLVLNTFTGMFLRPPFLITIADSKVKKIPYTELASPNPWFDMLRGIRYDEDKNLLLVSTSEGMYYSSDHFASPLKRFTYQPPVSVMGINVFEKYDNNRYLVGSFEGFFLWNYVSGEVYDYILKKPYHPVNTGGRPIGDFMVAGYIKDYKGQEIFIDYNFGASTFYNTPEQFPMMPDRIKEESPMSLWNFSLEFHTGRLYEFFMGDFYILVVPLVGLSTLFILISGFIVWWKLHRKKKMEKAGAE